MQHVFHGKWISNQTMSALQPRNVFHRQLDKREIDCTQHRNQHILFRKKFMIDTLPQVARIYISADDYYKLYDQRLLNALLHPGAWMRMLREGATSTFEGWGKETKKNASLFHLTMSYAALFLADIDLKKILS